MTAAGETGISVDMVAAHRSLGDDWMKKLDTVVSSIAGDVDSGSGFGRRDYHVPDSKADAVVAAIMLFDIPVQRYG